jgi:hypothetical protein
MKAQQDKRNLTDAIDQLRAQIAGNNSAIVTSATQVPI